MAKKKPSALEALTRHDEERLAMQTKGAELRRAAALELGLIVLDAGGSRLGTDALRRLIAGAVGAASKDRAGEKAAGSAAAEAGSGLAAESEGTAMAEPCNKHEVSDVAEVIALIADPATSYWLRDALVSACARDPFDAERDAMTLATLLTRRLDAIVARHFPVGR